MSALSSHDVGDKIRASDCDRILYLAVWTQICGGVSLDSAISCVLVGASWIIMRAIMTKLPIYRTIGNS